MEQVKVLARLGNSGLCPQNIDRDLQRKLGDNKYASSFDEVLPLKRLLLNPRRVTFANLRYPMMSPHRVFASIYRNYGEAWRRLFVPSGEELERFGRMARSGRLAHSSAGQLQAHLRAANPAR